MCCKAIDAVNKTKLIHAQPPSNRGGTDPRADVLVLGVGVKIVADVSGPLEGVFCCARGGEDVAPGVVEVGVGDGFCVVAQFSSAAKGFVVVVAGGPEA